MVGKTDRKAERERRHARVRTKISGTANVQDYAYTEVTRTYLYK